MQTSLYGNWMRRPLSSAVCPTPDMWNDTESEAAGELAWPRVRNSRARARAERAASAPRAARRPHEERVAAAVTVTPAHPGTYDTLDRETMMDEEKARILKMLEDKKIDADDAMKLLEALDRTRTRPTDRELKKKWLHIRVEKDGKQTVNLKLPLSLLKFGFKFAPQHIRGHGRVKTSEARAEDRARRAEERAERARAKVERAHAKMERARTKMERKLKEKLGEGAEINLNGVLEGAFEEAFKAGLETVKPVPPVPPVPPVNEMLDGFLDGDFDLDLEKILEMANDPDFDGNILDVYDDDDDERVVIRLD